MRPLDEIIHQGLMNLNLNNEYASANFVIIRSGHHLSFLLPHFYCISNWDGKVVSEAGLMSWRWNTLRALSPLLDVITLRQRQNGHHFADKILKFISMNEIFWILKKVSLKFVPKCLINNIPALIQIIAWHRPVTKPLSEPMMISLPLHVCVTQPQWVIYGILVLSPLNTLRPRQNGHHLPDNVFKCIFFNENVWISIKILLKFVRKGPINNIPALVQIMSWSQSGDKPLSEPMMVSLPAHICVTWPKNTPLWYRLCRVVE